jgi:hypothetical protein
MEAETSTMGMHPVTLAFANEALERAYAAREFRASFPVVVIFCCSQIFCSILLVLISPSLLPVLGFPAVLWGCLTVVRRHVSQLADQARAQLIFSWCWTGFILLAYSATALVQRWTILVSGLSTREMVCIALLHVMFALFQRFIALPGALRLAVLAGCVAGRAAMWPPFSELGQPHETLLVAAALLIGELLGMPVELSSRAAFARETSARELSDERPACSADATRFAKHALHPLTLRFADGAVEDAYSRFCFTEYQHEYLSYALTLSVLLVIVSFAVPATALIHGTVAATLLLMLNVRAHLHHSTDRAAHVRFAWGCCAMWAFAWAALVAAHRVTILVTGLLASEFAYITATTTLFAVFQRMIALPTLPRLLTLATVALAHFAWTPAFSELGQASSAQPAPFDIPSLTVYTHRPRFSRQPHEALLITGALITGEVLGLPFELQRRRVYENDQTVNESKTARTSGINRLVDSDPRQGRLDDGGEGADADEGRRQAKPFCVT